jgi:hypothetical protein
MDDDDADDNTITFKYLINKGCCYEKSFVERHWKIPRQASPCPRLGQ